MEKGRKTSQVVNPSSDANAVMKLLDLEEKWAKHYSSYHKILLVGEGDFSFSASLAEAFGSAANMTATSLDSEEFLESNYCLATAHLEELKRRGCNVMHGVDATSMANHPCLIGSTFDRIIFNFPHSGVFKSQGHRRISQIRHHQALVREFLGNAKQLLGEKGEIHITHKSNGFHLQWNIVSLAIQQGLELADCVDFDVSDYPGYSNKYGFGGDRSFDFLPSKTYMFRPSLTGGAPKHQFGVENTAVALQPRRQLREARELAQWESSLVGIEPEFSRNSSPQRELICHLSYPIELPRRHSWCGYFSTFCHLLLFVILFMYLV